MRCGSRAYSLRSTFSYHGRMSPSASEPEVCDLEVVRGVLAGDPTHVAELGHRLACVPRILRVLNNRRGGMLSAHDIEDVSQDVVTKIWTKLETFVGFGTLEIWAHRFCYLEFMNRIRARRRSAHQQRCLEQDASIAGTASPESRDLYEDLERRLDRLEPDEERIIRLKHYEERTFEEIAAILGVALGTAKSRYYRGMRQLRASLLRADEPRAEGVETRPPASKSTGMEAGA